MKLRYYGDLVDGKKEGTGQFSFEDGSFFSGEIKNGSLHGKGIAIWPSGTVYDGDWENGKRNGMGVEFNIRGKWRYEGQYKDYNFHGSGILHFEDGTFYSQTCVQRPSLGPEKHGRYTQGCMKKIRIQAGRYGFRLAVIQRWLLGQV